MEFDSDDMLRKGLFMILNIHAIDLRNITDVRGCTECQCNVTGVTPPHPAYTGGLNCCHSTSGDGGKCPIAAGVERSDVTYHIRYTITWRDFNSSLKPLVAMTLDVTDNNRQWSDFLPGGYKEGHAALHNDTAFEDLIHRGHSGMLNGHHACHVEYEVPPCKLGQPCAHRAHNSWRVPHSMDVVFIRSHLHTGAFNMTLSTEQSPICTGIPFYSNGFLSGITTCTLGDTRVTPLHLEEGSRLLLEAVYSQDDRPHFGVMGLNIIYAHLTGNSAALHV
jgi:hypothetical protein